MKLEEVKLNMPVKSIDKNVKGVYKVIGIDKISQEILLAKNSELKIGLDFKQWKKIKHWTKA